MLDPTLFSLGAGLFGSLFGKKPQYTPMQRLQQQIAQEQYQYSHSAPLSTAQEQLALAEQRGQLGEEQRQGAGSLMSYLQPGAGMTQGGTADLLRNLGSSQAGERGSLDILALLQSLNSRRQALSGAAQTAGAVGPKQEPGQDLSQAFSSLAYLYAQRKAMQPQQPRAQNTDVGAGSGGVQLNLPTPSYAPRTSSTGGFFGNPQIQGPPPLGMSTPPPAMTTPFVPGGGGYGTPQRTYGPMLQDVFARKRRTG
jgi:hypothetical protein